MSDNIKVDVVFRGDIAPGQNILDVREGVQKLFKADEQQLQRLFSGRPVTIRRGLDRAQADQYRKALLEAGALVELKPAKGDSQASEAGVAELAPREVPLATADDSIESGTVTAPEGGEFTLAPVGADVLRAEERPVVDAVDVDISTLSAEMPAGDLLDESEKKTVKAVEVDISHLSVEDLAPK